MDNLRGTFDTGLPAEDSQDWDADSSGADEEVVRDLPPQAIGQDERRMQVRAYNHWASLLGEASFPSIEDLEPENLGDFGPHSVLLDFSGGIDDPAVQFLGDKLAQECGATHAQDGGEIDKLSDVPPRSLLSRITDHYMQILANQAPIGFEAEFVNQRGVSILYRGILLPFSSDSETIDFIYGVINWKELADAATADELLLEIDQALDAGSAAPGEDEDQPHKHHSDPLTEWADSPAHETDREAAHGAAGEDWDEDADEHSESPGSADGEEDAGAVDENGLPMPDFGQYGLDEPEVDEFGEEIVEDEDEGAGYSFASLSDYIEAPMKKAVDLDADQFDPEDYRVEEPGAASTPLQAPDVPDTPANDVPSAGQDVFDNSFDETVGGANPQPAEEGAEAQGSAEVGDDMGDDSAGDTGPEEPAADAQDPANNTPETPFGVPASDADEAFDPAAPLPEDAGLYDCLASARELAHSARLSEDRSRAALYAAVARAYDFSLAANDEPEAYAELLEDCGLSVQERAPMTPVVKLVFGHDYDKTRLTEYAAVLSHAHRLGLARGTLADFLAGVEGGLKGVVASERRLRREEAGEVVEEAGEIRAQLARKLRELEQLTLEALDRDGPEFSLAVLRRDEHGNVTVLGEVGEDVRLTERAAKKLIG